MKTVSVPSVSNCNGTERTVGMWNDSVVANKGKVRHRDHREDTETTEIQVDVPCPDSLVGRPPAPEVSFLCFLN